MEVWKGGKGREWERQGENEGERGRGRQGEKQWERMKGS